MPKSYIRISLCTDNEKLSKKSVVANRFINDPYFQGDEVMVMAMALRSSGFSGNAINVYVPGLMLAASNER